MTTYPFTFNTVSLICWRVIVYLYANICKKKAQKIPPQHFLAYACVKCLNIWLRVLLVTQVSKILYFKQPENISSSNVICKTIEILFPGEHKTKLSQIVSCLPFPFKIYTLFDILSWIISSFSSNWSSVFVNCCLLVFFSSNLAWTFYERN